MRPTEPFSTDAKLPPGLGALMAAASAKRWLVVLADGRKFYLEDGRAQRFASKNPGSTIFPPGA